MKKLRPFTICILCYAMCISFSGCQSERMENVEKVEYVETKVGGFTFEIPENWEGEESAGNEQVGSYTIRDNDNNIIGIFSIIVEPNLTDEYLRSFTEYCLELLEGATSKINYIGVSNSDVCEFEGGEVTVDGKTWISFGKTVVVNSGLNFTFVSVEESHADIIKEEFDHIIDSMLE